MSSRNCYSESATSLGPTKFGDLRGCRRRGPWKIFIRTTWSKRLHSTAILLKLPRNRKPVLPLDCCWRRGKINSKLPSARALTAGPVCSSLVAPCSSTQPIESHVCTTQASGTSSSTCSSLFCKIVQRAARSPAGERRVFVVCADTVTRTEIYRRRTAALAADRCHLHLPRTLPRGRFPAR